MNWEDPQISDIILLGLREDIGSGDHSSLAAISLQTQGTAIMWLKEDAVIAGLPLAEKIFKTVDTNLQVSFFAEDGQFLNKGTKLLEVSGKAISILSSERLVLNFVQRLSGIATQSRHYYEIAKPYKTKLLDTRKTTPGLRVLEKYAVKLGGCENHRIGLFDMIMLKDNHIDFCGGITKAIRKTQEYLEKNNLSLPIEVETRNLKEVQEACECGGINRMMLDNFSPSQIIDALEIINARFETEASGGINQTNLTEYLKTGVDYISLGALTHSSRNIDISLKTSLII